MEALILQGVVNGLLIGGVFALVTVGLTLIWGVMRIINFAHGEFLMVGLYIGYFLVSELGMQPYVAGLIIVPALFLFGAGLFKATLERTLSHPTFNTLLLTLGLSLVLQNTALALFSATPRAVPSEVADISWTIGPVFLPLAKLVAFGVSLAATGILWWILQSTNLGRAIRASSQNSLAAGLMGIDVKRTYLFAFAIGSAAVGLSAVLILPIYYVTPTTGNFFGLIAFICAVLGGLGSFPGALVGGILIGLTEELGAVLLPGSLSRALTFGVFVLFLFLRPQGIFAPRQQT